MHRSLLSAVLSLSVLRSTLVAAQDASYTFTPLDVPGALITGGYGINDRDQIVGWFADDELNYSTVVIDDAGTPMLALAQASYPDQDEGVYDGATDA